MTIHKASVLIVEDSKSVTMMLKQFLKKLGYSDVHSTDTGNDAIQEFKKLVKAKKTPIVLLDFMLPDMDSRSVLTQILDVQPKTRVILETATDQQDEGVKELIRHGIYQYLEKPIRFEKIKKVFETIEKEDIFFSKNSAKIQEVETEIKTQIIDRVNFILKASKQVSLNSIEQMIGFSDENIRLHLKKLERDGNIINLGEKKEVACNECASVNTTQVFTCPSCNSSDFHVGKLIEHYSCGNISEEHTYENDKCPDCGKEIKALGVDYRAMNNHFICNSCTNFFSEFNTEYLCLKCDHRFGLDEVNWQSSCCYKIAAK